MEVLEADCGELIKLYGAKSRETSKHQRLDKQTIIINNSRNLTSMG
jgi:hypothetical protein